MLEPFTAPRHNVSVVEKRILKELRTDLKRSRLESFHTSKIQQVMTELRDIAPRWSLLLVRTWLNNHRIKLRL
jgi:gamma-glutamyl-gamma-aminobutyrate hydrolase PuuD